MEERWTMYEVSSVFYWSSIEDAFEKNKDRKAQFMSKNMGKCNKIRK